MIRSLTRFALTVLLLAIVAAPLPAQLFRRARVCLPPVVVACQPVVVEATQPVAPPKANEKTVSVNFNAKPWVEVLDWFAKESGMVLIATDRPTGTLTLKTDPNRKYTIAEVIDLLNTSLAYKKFILLRINPTTFTLVPADETIPDVYIQRITTAELKLRAYTEPVQVVVQFKGFTMDEILPQVRLRLSARGETKPLGLDHILLTDFAGNIRAILDDLKTCTLRDSFTHRCQFVPADEAADALRKLLGGSPAVSIAVEESTNTLLVAGPSDKLATAQKLLKELDVGGTPRTGAIETSTLRIYTVPAKTAESLARLLSDKYAAGKNVRVAAVPGKDEVMVLAPASIHAEIDPKPAPYEKVVPRPPCPATCPRPVGPAWGRFPRLCR